MTKEEKKIFVFKIHPQDKDINKEWFVWYYEPLNNGTAKKRVKIAKGINRLKTVDQRMEFAQRLISELQTQKSSEKSQVKIEPTKSILAQVIDSKANFCCYRTLRGDRLCLRIFQKYLNGKSELEVTRKDAIGFLNHLFTLNYANKTIKGTVGAIKALYNRYIDLNDLDDFKNPFLRLPIVRTHSKSKMYFNELQQAKMKKYLSEHNPDLWLACQLQFYCFIRPNELRQLKSENININAGYIEIPSEIAKNRKTQKVMIPTHFLPELLFVDKLNQNEFIFKDRNGNCVSHSKHWKQHSKVLKHLGFSSNYSFYSWKHTGVVKAVKAGIHIKDIQLQLRHHSLDMVNEYLKNLGVMDMDRIRDLFPSI